VVCKYIQYLCGGSVVYHHALHVALVQRTACKWVIMVYYLLGPHDHTIGSPRIP
jgi:hypothetical protein